MKLVIILITVACLQVSASALAQKITLNEKDAPLEKIFNDIKEQTGCNFFYEHNILNGTPKVTINVKDANLRDVLNQCLANQSLVYTIAGNNIGVKKKENQSTQTQAPQPSKDVTGQVTTKQGIPLNGASVFIKRTQTGTLTDAKGMFTIRNVNSDDILIVSYIGYKRANITIGDNAVFNIVLEEATNALDQVVVQAYGTTTRRLNTGDIATVSAAEIERQPVMNPLIALQGKVPGVDVTTNNGYASAPVRIEIRGRSVIDDQQPSEPLYIIDGVPLTVLNISGNNYASGSSGFNQGITGPAGGQSPFFSVNPQDIESITVLKDADATALYGSRGANGVIIITTKKGKAGKTQLDFNLNHGESLITQRYNLLNTQQYLMMRNEAFKNDETVNGLNSQTTKNTGNAYDILTWDNSRYTDWQKVYWGGTGHTTDAELSLSGGDKENTFRIGSGYNYSTGIMQRSGGDQRGSLQFNYHHTGQNQRLSLDLTSMYSYTQSKLIAVGGGVLESPDAPAIFNSQGNLNWAGWQPVPDQLNNWGSLFQPYTGTVGFLNSQLALKYQIAKGLTFSSTFGYSTSHGQNSLLTEIASQNPINATPYGSSRFSNTNLTTTIVEPQLEYKRIVGRDGKLNVMVGASTQSVSEDANIELGDGYINDNLLNSLVNAPNTTSQNSFGNYKYAGVFGRINYNWADEYLLNLSFRRDGSSRFGPGHQYGNFWAVGAAWIFTEEKWFKDNLSWLSLGKLRGSYGLTGNDLIGDYGYLTQWSAVGNNSQTYQGNPYYIPLGHANPNLHWETNRKLEGAIELGFFKDRITLNFDWYQNRCGDQLVYFPLPIATGFGEVMQNSPALVQNTGTELVLTGKIIDQKDFSWSTSFNIGVNSNKLIAYPNLAQSPYATLFDIGKSLSNRRLLHYTGIDPQTGQYTFEDKNHNGTIDYQYNNGNNDLYTKDLAPKFFGGLATDFRYKGWSLNLFFIFKKQELRSAAYQGYPGSVNSNESVAVLNAWQKPGDQTQFARYTQSPQQSDLLFAYSDGVYSDGSFIRLQNASLAYDLPENWIHKIGIRKCSLYARGQNLFTLTKYDGDPQVPGLGALPIATTFIIGLKFTL